MNFWNKICLPPPNLFLFYFLNENNFIFPVSNVISEWKIKPNQGTQMKMRAHRLHSGIIKAHNSLTDDGALLFNCTSTIAIGWKNQSSIEEKPSQICSTNDAQLKGEHRALIVIWITISIMISRWRWQRWWLEVGGYNDWTLWFELIRTNRFDQNKLQRMQQSLKSNSFEEFNIYRDCTPKYTS